MKDTEIVALYLQRSEEAIAQTGAVYGNKLYRLAFGILKLREDAEETVSDTYLKAWNSIPPQIPMHLFAYLAKICRFLAFGKLDWNNAAKRKAEVVELTAEMELCIPDHRREQEQESAELGRQLNAFLGTLPEETMLIFLRRYWYADSIADIASRYSMTESKVKSQLFRARSKLRTYLQKEGITV